MTTEKGTAMKKKAIKQSETIDIKRSQINLNPFNPKRHSDKKIAEQKKNLQKVGYLGGITWNRQTGNLIDGHRRIKAMDLYYGYDGTPDKDYTIKVEAVDFDEKTEKEQMTYMAVGNTRADFQLIAEYLPDIDYTAAGIDEYDLERISAFLPSDAASMEIETYEDLIQAEQEYHPDKGNGQSDGSMSLTDKGEDAPDEAPDGGSDKKSLVKDAKRSQMEAAEKRYESLTAYLTISFDNPDDKLMLCEMIGIDPSEKFVKASDILELIQ